MSCALHALPILFWAVSLTLPVEVIPQTRACDLDDDGAGTCPAPDGPADLLAGDRQRLRERWLAEHRLLRSEHAVAVHTLNFNDTVSDAARRGEPLLLVFVDSADVRKGGWAGELRELDAAADMLATQEDDGTRRGVIGLCDVALDTFLGMAEVPKIRGWYRNTLDRNMSLPLTIALFKETRFVEHYEGPIHASAIISYMRRVGPSPVLLAENANSVSGLLREGVPVVLGCDVSQEPSADDHQALRSVASDAGGRLGVCIASFAMCGKVLRWEAVPPAGSAPKLVWAMMEGKKLRRRTAPSSLVISDAAAVHVWVNSILRLEELTLANLEVYISSKRPLLVLFVNRDDRAGRRRAEQYYEAARDGMPADAPEFNVVFCICEGAAFARLRPGKQPACPHFFVRNSVTSLALSLELSDLTHPRAPDRPGEPWTASAGTPAERLRALLSHPLWRSEAADASAVEDLNSGTTLEPPGVRFLQIPDSWNLNITAPKLTERYIKLLMYLAYVNTSVQERYPHLKLEFRDLERAEALHPGLRMPVHSAQGFKSLLDAHWSQPGAKLEEGTLLYAAWKHSQILRLDLGHDEQFRAALAKGMRYLSRQFKRVYKTLHAHARNGTLGVRPSRRKEVERRAASGLSVREFFERYAVPGRAVIITGLNLSAGDEWSLPSIRERCGERPALLKRQNHQRASWGRLETAASMTVAEFIDSFKSNVTRRDWYLHDWSLTLKCPGAFGRPPFDIFTIPKYFVGDYYQRGRIDKQVTHNWPSLFVGAKGLESALHIDDGYTNFFMYTLSGRKEWRFFSRSDLVNLYKDPLGAQFHVDAFKPDLGSFPLYQYAVMQHAVQEPGEVIFVPAGSPHYVRNLEDFHGVSMNWVDASNIHFHLMDTMYYSRSLHEFLHNPPPLGMRSKEQHLTMGEWKSMPWHLLEFDLQF